MISIVVAADQNGAIGAKNRIPWRLRDDLIRLKELTLGHTVILGRKSYDSMVGYYDASGRSMPGQTYVIVTRNPEYQPARDNTRVVFSMDEAMTTAYELGDDEILIIGGGDIFKAGFSVADRIYLTEVQTKVDDADAFFPAIDKDKWVEGSREHHFKDDRNEFDYDIVVYERRKD